MTQKTIFLAGATGAIGRRLLPMLVQADYTVYGTTRSPAKVAQIQAAGGHAVVVDMFDAAGVDAALAQIKPDLVVHQLTDLPRDLDPARMAQAVIGNARIRDEGTRNLIQAALHAGCSRVIAQSIAWIYAPGPQPYTETSPLDLAAEGSKAISLNGVLSLERQVLAAPVRGTILRYGRLYGPHTSTDQPAGDIYLHVDAAAHAALLAVQQDAMGVFNLAEPSATISSDKAVQQLGWSPDYRCG